MSVPTPSKPRTTPKGAAVHAASTAFGFHDAVNVKHLLERASALLAAGEDWAELLARLNAPVRPRVVREGDRPWMF